MPDKQPETQKLKGGEGPEEGKGVVELVLQRGFMQRRTAIRIRALRVYLVVYLVVGGGGRGIQTREDVPLSHELGSQCFRRLFLRV